MNAQPGKSSICILVLILVLNLSVPIATAARECTDHPCCCRDNVAMAHPGQAQDVYSAENGCCPTASKLPCNLNEDYGRHSPVFTVSSSKNDVPYETVRIISADVVSSFHKTFGESSATGEFRSTPDSVPIYLHTLALIC